MSEETQQQHGKQLMDARRQVKGPKKQQLIKELQVARAAVGATKVSLGERARASVWWKGGGEPDYN